jgi:CMP-N,N'-diacetyllegionaminic acid synthase
MINGQTILAIIPARGGSKRLPRKAVMELCGKPLIAWSIESAKESKYIDRIIVSTDDVEIALISRQFGVETPFMRPDDLATDTSTSIDVVNHALNFIAKRGEKYDYVMLLQPTSPLRTSEHIDEAIELLELKSADGIVSVCECEHHSKLSGVLPNGSSLDNFLQHNNDEQRQQGSEKLHRLNGSIYLMKTVDGQSCNNCFPAKNGFAYVMETTCSVDIDTAEDFKQAEIILQSRNV